MINSLYEDDVVISMNLYEDDDVMYVDFAKAFDKIDHGVLAFKLRS